VLEIDEMAHLRRPIAIAFGLNTLVFAVETASGVASDSLTLLMDAAHNLSDELGLGLLVIAYSVRRGLSGHAVRWANLFNGCGLLAIVGFLLWQALHRLLSPVPVAGLVPVVAGLVAAVGNWGVARSLREPSRHDVSVRLAYVHNLGDVFMSLTLVAAGVLTLVTGNPLADPAIALAALAVILVSTLRSLRDAGHQFFWPERVGCDHA
jgi:cobalt-zinc-cadmium efflux system protein